MAYQIASSENHNQPIPGVGIKFVIMKSPVDGGWKQYEIPKDTDIQGECAGVEKING